MAYLTLQNTLSSLIVNSKKMSNHKKNENNHLTQDYTTPDVQKHE